MNYKEDSILEEQKNKSISENLELLERAVRLRKRTQKILNIKGEEKNENIKSE